jgi:hypothetical protein
MFTANIPNFFLILPPTHFIRYTFLKSSDHHVWKDLLSWSWSDGTVVVFQLSSCCQNVVPYHEAFEMHLFQMVIIRLMHWNAVMKSSFQVFTAWITDLVQS